MRAVEQNLNSPRRRSDNFTTHEARLSSTASARSRLEQWIATAPLRQTTSRSAFFSLKHTDSYAPSRASSFNELQARRTPGVAYRKTNKPKREENQTQQEERPSSYSK